MSTIKNHVQLIGNVGQEPTITNLESGKKVARLSLATNENYKNSKGERQTNTNWHTVIAWGKTADIIERYVIQGKEIGIVGQLKTRSYETKEGDKRYLTEVIANEILLLNGNPSK
ncbi:single-stranded DNA-binding protein [Aureibaculum luteum]|uniref:single-stranded DNA-binding protein n=1 Tax=Aureibaculum luteum TaxID=1548456 RepID=UPI000E4E7BCF|nr:single-stranded DNA-binding protein [Aureibaculum luteum]